MTRWQAFTDVALAVALVLLLGLLAGFAVSALPAGLLPPLLLMAAVQGAIVLGVVAALLAWRRDSLRGIGLVRFQAHDLSRGLAAWLLAILTAIALNMLLLGIAPAVLEAHVERLSLVASLLAADIPLVLLLGSVLFIGLYEELLARGLLLQRCRVFLRGTWPPVLASSLLFGLGHLYQGWTGVLQTMVIGILFARLALHWGSLWPVIIAHSALNGFSLLVLRGVSG